MALSNKDYKMASRATITQCSLNAGLILESFEIRKGMRLHAVVRKPKQQ